MKKIKVTALLMLITVLVGLVLVSCSSPYSEEYLLEVFKEKYARSYVLNEYIWGDGIPASEHSTENITTDSYYVTVSNDSEFKSKAAFIEALNSVYVSDFVSGEIDQLLFTGYGEDGPAPRYGEIDGFLSINVLDKGNENVGIGKFLPETARVKKATGSTVIFTVTYESNGKTKDYDLMMRLDGEEWKFEAPTY